MKPDELKPQSPVKGLPGEDLSVLSLKELQDRVARLEAEIDRCRAAIEAKEGALSDAEAYFRR